MYRSKKNEKKKRYGVAALATAGLVAGGLGLATASGAATANPHSSATHRGPHFEGPRGPRGGGGEVTSLDSSSVTVTHPDGTSTTYTVNAATVVEKGHSSAAQSDLAVGERVRVRPSSSASTTAAEIDIIPARVGGKVVSASSDSIVVADQDGFYRTISTSSSTSYDKSGASASAADVTVGTFVGAEGTVDANHTTLDATTVHIGLPSDQGPGMGDPMGMH